MQVGFGFARVDVSPPDFIETGVPLKILDLRAGPQDHIRCAFNALDKVARHAFGEAGTADEYMHARGKAREEYSRPSR